jgi:hypothetical protein
MTQADYHRACAAYQRAIAEQEERMADWCEAIEARGDIAAAIQAYNAAVDAVKASLVPVHAHHAAVGGAE